MRSKVASPKRAETTFAVLDADALAGHLEEQGFALLPGMLTAEDCRSLATSYGDRSLFRSRVIMARHGFGRGEYQYFRYPLPEIVGVGPKNDTPDPIR